MKDFIKVVRWKYFFKIIGGFFLFLLWSKYFRPKDSSPLSWLFVILVTLFVGAFLLSYAYLQYRIKKPPVVLTVKELRRKKLKRINRIW